MKKLLLFFVFLTLITANVIAIDPSIWSVNSRSDVLKGDARRVSIDNNGTITLAPKLTEVYRTEQPYIWSSAVDAGGNVYLGTGGDGKIFKVGTGGSGNLFTDLNELNVTALAIGKGGELFAATSPDGKVYQIDAAGKSSVYFDAKEKYIWSLVVLNDGSLAVGTGEGGKIYRVKSANSAPESSLLFDTSETHIITLAADRAGNLYAGTDTNGLVMRFGPDGKPFGLLDSPLREIHEISIGSDGSIYVLALGESASVAVPSTGPAASPVGDKTVTSDAASPAAPAPPQKSRYDLTGAKSAVYRILPDGGTDIIWASAAVAGFSIHSHQDGGVLLGTSDKGRIYNIGNDGRETLVLQSDTNQVSTIRSSGQNLIATSSNQGSLFRFGAETVVEGVYESAVLDAKTDASWGRIWWRSSGNVQIQTRSGNTGKADETWSSWNTVTPAAMTGQVGSPRARYLQWRAVLKNTGGPASLSEVNVAFLGRNIAPEILSITALPANVGLIANPPVQIDPNIELSGLDPATFGIPNVALGARRVFQRAAKSFQWTAEDRNGDKLVYDVFYKETSEIAYKPLRENIAENFISLDGLSLPDGRYTLRIVAKDSPDNPAARFLTGVRISEPFDVDNSQPTVAVVGTPLITGDRARAVFTANDRSSYLTRAEFNVNGGEWQAVYSDDGISDSPDERYTIDMTLKTPGEYTITLRVFDASGNAGNAKAIVKR